MGNYEQLKQSVSDVIKTNGNQEITGSILQNVLLTIISSVGANATFAGIATPATNPGTPDGLVFYLASESGTYTNFNAIELQDGLSVLMWNGSWSSQQIFGVDDEPTAGSDNLVKSGGIVDNNAKNIGSIDLNITAKNTPIFIGAKKGYVLNFYISNRNGESVVLSKTSTWDASTNLTVFATGNTDKNENIEINDNYDYIWLSGGSGSPTLTVKNVDTIYQSVIKCNNTIGSIDIETTKKNTAIYVGIKAGIPLNFKITNRSGEKVVLSKTSTWDASTNLTVVSAGNNDVDFVAKIRESYDYVWINGGSGNPTLSITNAKDVYSSISEIEDVLHDSVGAINFKSAIKNMPLFVGIKSGYKLRFNITNRQGEAVILSKTSTWDETANYTVIPFGSTDISKEVTLNDDYDYVWISSGTGSPTLTIENAESIYSTALKKGKLVEIYDDDIYFNVGESIFHYPSDAVTNNITINDECQEVADNTKATSELVQNNNLAGCWKLYCNNGTKDYDNIPSGFRMTLYSGSNPVKSLYVAAKGNSPIAISERFVNDNSIDGYRVTFPNSVDWTKLILTRESKYSIRGTVKKEYVERYGINLAFFPREEGETDDTARINRALLLAQYGGSVTIPAGEYIVSSTIAVNYWQHIHLEDGAIIKASDSFVGDYVLKYIGGGQFTKGNETYRTTEKYFVLNKYGKPIDLQQSLDGGCIDANGKAGGIYLTGFRNFQLQNMLITNAKTEGICTYHGYMSYELMMSKVTITNSIGGNSGNIGVRINNSDNHLSDVVVVDYTTGFLLEGYSNRLSRCHHWNGPANDEEYIADSISFDVRGGDNVLTGCYADTSETNYKIGSDANGCRMIGCGSFSNLTEFTVPTCTRIHNDADRLVIIAGRFVSMAGTGGQGDAEHTALVDGSKAIWQEFANVGLS